MLKPFGKAVSNVYFRALIVRLARTRTGPARGRRQAAGLGVGRLRPLAAGRGPPQPHLSPALGLASGNWDLPPL